jgi:hypothetical protein
VPSMSKKIRSFGKQFITARTLMSWEANLSAGSSGSERPIEHCADILLRMAGQVPVTDDTMGSEWLHFFGRE